MINTNNIEKAKKLIKECKEKPIVLVAQEDNFNRKILEYGKFDILLFVGKEQRKDSLRQIDSGLNHVLAKEALKNKVSIGIDLDEISRLDKKEKAKCLGRIKQNIKICRKAGVKIKLLNYKCAKDASSFLTTLGASSRQSKEAISF